MINRIELKERAKKSLENHYGDAIVVLLLTSIITNVVTFIPSGFAGGVQGIGDAIGNFFLSTSGFFLEAIACFLSIIVASFLSFGSLSFFLKISRDEKTDYRELFTKFNMAIPYILITLVTSIFVFLWSLLFIIPGIIAAISYTLVYYIALDNPEIDVLDALNQSKKMMYGHKFDFFILQLSFMGWIILGLFTCGILYFWLIPYITVTNCNFYNQLKKEYEEKHNINKKEETTVIEEKKTTSKEEVPVIGEDKKKETTSKKSSSSKTTTSKKASATKTSTKKTTTKTAASKNSTPKKTSTKSTSSKNSTTKKTTSKPKNAGTKKTSNKKDTK